MTPVATTQVTHNDLDGYGASTICGALIAVDRVEHVTRYSDVNPVFAALSERLAMAADPELVVVTDIAVEAGLAGAIRGFAGANEARVARYRQPHGLLVIDHHASSMDVLERAGFRRVERAVETPHGIVSPSAVLFEPHEQSWKGRPQDAPVTVLVDPTRSATGLCWDHAHLLISRGVARHVHDPERLGELVEAVDAVDLWARERPTFDAGAALNDIFWECVLTYLPAGHPRHDAFMSRILMGLADRIWLSEPAYAVEGAGNEIRRSTVGWLVQVEGLSETPRQRLMSTRMRASRVLAKSKDLFVEPIPGRAVKLCHAMDPGIFQRVSDFMLDEDGLECVVNVMRGGAMSFRSRDGQALEMASRFGGGGHANASGARLDTSAVFSLDEAMRLVTGVLRKGDPSDAPAWQP